MCLPDVFGVLQVECDHMISQTFKVFIVCNENDSLLFPNESLSVTMQTAEYETAGCKQQWKNSSESQHRRAAVKEQQSTRQHTESSSGRQCEPTERETAEPGCK